MTQAATICAQARCPNPAVRRGRCAEHQRASTRAWARLRRQVLARARGRCERCGERSAALAAVHHVDEVGLGGVELPDPDRLLALCGSCHRAVHR